MYKPLNDRDHYLDIQTKVKEEIYRSSLLFSLRTMRRKPKVLHEKKYKSNKDQGISIKDCRGEGTKQAQRENPTFPKTKK